MKILVINENSPAGPRSTPSYNLACDRITQYHRNLGDEVLQDRILRPMDLIGCDKVYFSICFTWDLPKAIEDINQAKNYCNLEIGGPAATAMPDYIKNMTGCIPHVGLDERFENIPGTFGAGVSSRGCPRGCVFCLVPRLEGRKISVYHDFTVPVGGYTGFGNNPYMIDNNILATPWEHQQLFVEKLKKVKNLDVNSGFDCRIFCKDPEKYYNLYSQLDLDCWRFAYDVEEEREPLKICADYLHGKGVNYRYINVFCLVGGPGQTYDMCVERLEYIKKLDCSGYPMRYRPLNILQKPYTPPGWDENALEVLFNYFGVPRIWRKTSWGSFKKNYRRTSEYLQPEEQGGFQP